MPKKRPLDERIAEAEDLLERLKLERNIRTMKAKFGRSRPRRRR
jgi:hypothetical protein